MYHVCRSILVVQIHLLETVFEYQECFYKVYIELGEMISKSLLHFSEVL